MTQATQQEMQQYLQAIRPLTAQQREAARQAAIGLIKQRNGDRPTRAQFMREHGRAWDVLDLLAVIIFLAALAVSSVHIFQHMAHIVGPVELVAGGIEISSGAWVALHQIGYLALSESTMILFIVMARTTRVKWLMGVFYALSMLSAAFVVVANLSSGIGLFESLLPPLFTIGIGFRLEHIIAQGLKRRRDVDIKYMQAMMHWEHAANDPTQHDDYARAYRNALLEALIDAQSGRGKSERQDAIINAPRQLKQAFVRRELLADRWADFDLEADTLVLPESGKTINTPTDGNGTHAPIAQAVNGHYQDATEADF